MNFSNPTKQPTNLTKNMQNMNPTTETPAFILMNREQYLTLTVEWITRYRELSAGQRKLKQEIREAQMEQRGDDVSLLCLRRNSGRKAATEMLARRAEIKVAAQASYRASKMVQGIGACLL
jgi:hypothetical protein